LDKEKYIYNSFSPNYTIYKFVNFLLPVIFIFISLLISKISASQDLHYSQYFNSELNLNPALTAYTQGKYRFTLNNRNQWASVTVPYKTLSASFETKIINFKRKRTFIGFGVLFNKDEAGDSKYGTTEIGFSLSAVKSLNNKNTNIISLGFQTAYYQRSIDYTQLYFPEQWNGITSTINSGNSENFAVAKFNFFDVSAGINWFWAPSSKLKFNSGISSWHLNKPNQSLMNDKTTNLNIKYQAYSNIEIIINQSFNILPGIYYAHLWPYQEFILGSRLYYKIHQNRNQYFALSTGLFFRNKDALILYLGMDYKTLKIGATYDINTSSLSVASNYMGGMEISIKWLIHKGKDIRKISPTPCPIF